MCPVYVPAGRPVYLYVPVMGSFSLLSLGTNNSGEAGGAGPDLALTSQWEGGRSAVTFFPLTHRSRCLSNKNNTCLDEIFDSNFDLKISAVINYFITIS